MLEIQGLPAWRWLRLKWRIRVFVMQNKWHDMLVRIGLRKAPPKADPRSRIVNGIQMLFDPPADKRELH